MSRTMARVLVAISAHGLGHLGQMAPVCQALCELRPDIDLTIWSMLPEATLRGRMTSDFHYLAAPCDIGFVMHDALQVDIPASWARYRQRETDWASHLDAACRLVCNVSPDLIISDVGEMPLAAGQALNVPNIAMSSLNWADMARFYFQDLPGALPVLTRLNRIYNQTTLALRLTPGMPMHGQKEIIVPPVGALSPDSKAQLRTHLEAHLPEAYRARPWVLIGMGGIESALPMTHWPAQTTLTLVVANQHTLPAEGLPEKGIVNGARLAQLSGLHFTDLLKAADAVICKPGYGTFVEAALAATPLLYVPRTDWPEQSVLTEWLHTQALCAALPAYEFAKGYFADALQALLSQPVKPPIPSQGASVTAAEILRLLPA